MIEDGPIGDGWDVVGLDLSLARTGVADRKGTRVISTLPATPLPKRLIQIRDHIMETCPWADLIVIEDLPKHVAHGGPELGMAHGVVRTALEDRLPTVPIVLVPPASLKSYATGKGSAKKDDVRMEVYKRFDLDIRDNNEADAFVLRAIGLDLLGVPLVKMPVNHRAPLAKLQLPWGPS